MVSWFARRILSTPASKNGASVTGPTIGMRYSKFASNCVSPPGVMSW